MPDFFSEPCRAKLAFKLTATRGAHLPDFLDFAVFREFFEEEVAPVFWQPAAELVDSAHKLVDSTLTALLTTGKALGALGCFPRLSAAVAEALVDAAGAVRKELDKHVDTFLQLETKIIYTQNYYYTSLIDKIATAQSGKADKDGDGYHTATCPCAACLCNQLEADESPALHEMLMANAVLPPGSDEYNVRKMQISLCAYAKARAHLTRRFMWRGGQLECHSSMESEPF